MEEAHDALCTMSSFVLLYVLGGHDRLYKQYFVSRPLARIKSITLYARLKLSRIMIRKFWAYFLQQKKVDATLFTSPHIINHIITSFCSGSNRILNALYKLCHGVVVNRLRPPFANGSTFKCDWIFENDL